MKFAGCFGYALASILSGYVIASYDTAKILPVFAVVLFGIGCFLLLIRVNVKAEKKEVARKLQVRRIIKDTNFLIFLIFIFFMKITHRAAYTFYPVHIS